MAPAHPQLLGGLCGGHAIAQSVAGLSFAVSSYFNHIFIYLSGCSSHMTELQTTRHFIDPQNGNIDFFVIRILLTVIPGEMMKRTDMEHRFLQRSIIPSTFEVQAPLEFFPPLN